MKPLKSLIIEDEVINADLLKHFLTKYCPEIEIIGTCVNKAEALETIPRLKPINLIDVEWTILNYTKLMRNDSPFTPRERKLLNYLKNTLF